jgi:hypothetical protein
VGSTCQHTCAILWHDLVPVTQSLIYYTVTVYIGEIVGQPRRSLKARDVDSHSCSSPPGRTLVEKNIQSLHKGHLVYIEGRLVLTTFRVRDSFWQMHEILADEVMLL